MWKSLFRPDFVFTLVTCQALSPYIFWQFGVGRAIPSYSLNYIPIAIWGLGWISFLGGSFLARSDMKGAPLFILSPQKQRVRLLIWMLIGVSILELYFAI